MSTIIEAQAPEVIEDVTTTKAMTPTARTKFARLTELRTEKNSAEKESKELSDWLLDWMGDSVEAMSGKVRVFKVQSTTRDNVSVKTLAEQFPEAYEALNKPTTYKSIR